VIKIGGNIIDNEEKLSSFIQSFAQQFCETGGEQATLGRGLLVHGGGKLVSSWADQLGIRQQLVDGRRITDAATLKLVTMVCAGYINKNIVARLQAQGCNAIGLTGADAGLIRAHKRVHPSIDYGFVGDIDSLDAGRLSQLINDGLTPVLAPITCDREGQLLNTNADTIAQETAKAMSNQYDVQLIYSFEKSGVLFDVDDDSTVIPRIDPQVYAALKTEKKIFAGMIPKIDNAFAALKSGVKKVIIGNAEELVHLLDHTAGTIIVNE
jgi:acetylglutamate kinase